MGVVVLMLPPLKKPATFFGILLHFSEYCVILLHIEKDVAMQLMSIEDLAAYLCVSKRTIYKYIASGDCPPYIKLSKKNISFDRVDVDAWLLSKKVDPKQSNERKIK